DIIGTFKNDCNRKFSQVTVSFKLDRSSSGSAAAEISTALHPGAKPDSTPRRPAMELPEAVILAYARDVQPGETRKFKSSTPHLQERNLPVRQNLRILNEWRVHERPAY